MATYKPDMQDDELIRAAGGRSAGGNRTELDEGRVVLGSGGRVGDRASDQESYAASPSGQSRILGGQDDLSNDDGPGPQVMAAETLTGDEVVNSAGDKLGKIESIMLDVSSGRIAYAVLSSGGFLGIGDKLFAIPWQALKLDADNHCFILEVDKAQLQNAPGFDKDNWPLMGDQQWASEIHSYYGTRPYWE